MTRNNYKFKGGDKLTGMHKDYHNIMMKNELVDGWGAYEFNWAGTTESGPSFGGNQMDIAHNAHGREVLLDIITNATNAQKQPFMSTEEIKEVEQILKQPFQMRGKSAQLFGFNKRKMEAALESDYGRQKIDEAHVNEITIRAEKVERFIAHLKDGHGKKFAESRGGKLYIFDYNNQYDLTKNGPLHKHLSGKKVKLQSGKAIPAFDGSEFTMINFWNFLMHLQYYDEHWEDVDRRVKNINKYLEDHPEEEQHSKIADSEICNDCAKLYEAYAAYLHSMTAANGIAFDETVREFGRKYPGGPDICKVHGFDFDKFSPSTE